MTKLKGKMEKVKTIRKKRTKVKPESELIACPTCGLCVESKEMLDTHVCPPNCSICEYKLFYEKHKELDNKVCEVVYKYDWIDYVVEEFIQKNTKPPINVCDVEWMYSIYTDLNPNNRIQLKVNSTKTINMIYKEILKVNENNMKNQ